MQVKIELTGEDVTAFISGEIDHHNAGELREAIDDAVERAYPERLILDMGGVTFMDSSGLGLMMGRWKLMQTLSGELMVVNAPNYIKKVMRVAGLERLCAGRNGEAVKAK